MFGVDTVLKLIDFLFARGFDALRWQQARSAVKAQLEDWHASAASDGEKIAALDAALASIDANSATIRDA